MKKGLWLGMGLISLAIAMPLWAEESQAKAAVAPETPVYNEHFGIGACIGKGAGLLGMYGYYRPIDLLAFEADIGYRMFLFETTGAYSSIDVYWPLMVAGKVQFYFLDRQHRFQPGIEAGLVNAEDMGPGGEVSGIINFRLSRRIHLDANCGFGSFFEDTKNHQIDYLVKVRGGRRSYYEHLDFAFETQFFLMWGVGISVVF